MRTSVECRRRSVDPVRNGGPADDQKAAEYRAVFDLVQEFLGATALPNEGNDFSAVAKQPSRVFEQWSFLKIVRRIPNVRVGTARM